MTRDRISLQELYYAQVQLQRAATPVLQEGCWLGHHGRFENGPMPSCDGELIKAHLIPRQKLVRELGAKAGNAAVKDSRTWVWACGGPTGIGGHHGAFDSSRRLRVPWSEMPPDLIELCHEWERTRVWRAAFAWLELTYRRRAVPASHRAGVRYE